MECCHDDLAPALVPRGRGGGECLERLRAINQRRGAGTRDLGQRPRSDVARRKKSGQQSRYQLAWRRWGGGGASRKVLSRRRTPFRVSYCDLESGAAEIGMPLAQGGEHGHRIEISL